MKASRRFSERTFRRAPTELERFLNELGVSTDFKSYGIGPDRWEALLLDAFDGERGQNFIGTRQAMLQAAGLKERENARAS